MKVGLKEPFYEWRVLSGGADAASSRKPNCGGRVGSDISNANSAYVLGFNKNNNARLLLGA